MAGIELRRGLAPGDMPTLLAWANAGGEAFLKRFAGPKWRYPLTQDQVAGEIDAIHSIYVDGAFAGILQQLARHEHSVHLGRFVIDPARTGRGIGGLALRKLCRELFRDAEVDAVTLNVYTDNAPARRCYEKCGFRVKEVYPEWGNCRMELLRAEAAARGIAAGPEDADRPTEGSAQGAFERARAGDIDELAALRLAYLSEDGGVGPEDAARMRRELPGYFERHLNRDLTAFVARKDGEIVACALLLQVEMPMSPAFINGRTGTVLNVYTKPEHRGRGCARRLMEMLLEEAKALGLSRVELKATPMGEPLYRALGFQDAGAAHRWMQWRPSRG